MKKLGLICGGILVLLLVVYFGGISYLNGKIDSLVAKANNGEKQLTIGQRNLSFRFTHLGLQLDSIQLRQEVGNQRVSGTIRKIEMDGLNIWKALHNKIELSDLRLLSPDLELRPIATDSSSKAEGSSDQPIDIDKLRIEDGKFLVFDQEDKVRIKGSGLTSTVTLHLPLAPAAAPDAHLTIDSLTFPSNDGTDLTLSHTEFDSDAATLSTGKLLLTPRQTAQTYLTSLKFKDDWMALRVDSIMMKGVPVDSLLAKSPSIFPDVTISDFNLAVFENPNLERDPAEKYKPFPVEQFRNLPLPAMLQKLHIKRANLSYGVCAENTKQPDITFEGSVDLTNFSTWKQNKPAVAKANFSFEGTSTFNIRFEFDQAGSGRNFRAVGELSQYDLVNINPLMVIAANADLESGTLNKLTHDFSSTNNVSSGKLTFHYEGLEVKLTGKKAFFGNLLEDIAIRDSNPRNDGDLIIGKVKNEHNLTKSFFNHYWKSLVSGMKSTVTGGFFLSEEAEGRRIEAGD